MNKHVKVTNALCKHRGCNCRAYIGYQLPNGRYSGKCQNSDGWGHTFVDILRENMAC